MLKSIQLLDTGSYKVGINEVKGLKGAMLEAMLPVQESIKSRVYWNDCELEESEYQSRDGFIPHSHNCGGIDLTVVIPSCEQYEFSFLEFGKCDECGEEQCGYKGQECAPESDGHLDAKLRVWLKFEGISHDSMGFYLYAGGGNGDAPYFRTKYETDIFEASFECGSVAEFKRASKKHVAALLKKIK